MKHKDLVSLISEDMSRVNSLKSPLMKTLDSSVGVES